MYNSLYTFKECFEETVTSKLVPKLCKHIAFREHPHISHRLPCGCRFLNDIVTKNRKNFYSFKTYCYYPIQQSLINILSQNNHLNKCEEWRNRIIPTNCLADVYDGRIWEKFQVYNNEPFLAKPYNMALMLNCDWFQPYQHSQYSVGVLYLVILNLPHVIRFKPENIIISSIKFQAHLNLKQ